MTKDAKPQTQESTEVDPRFTKEGRGQPAPGAATPKPKAPETGAPSLRDFYAAHALQGLLSHPGGPAQAVDTAREAYTYADAMLAARPKGEA